MVTFLMTDDTKITLPSHVAGSGNLDRLVDTARDYGEAAAAPNTLTAYKVDWKHFGRWGIANLSSAVVGFSGSS